MALLDKIRPAGGFSKATAGHIVYRFIQMIFALAVVGLYAQDLNRANKAGKYQDGKWIYATIVGSLAAVTALVYMIPLIVRIPFIFVWDTILFILWIALFGVFGALFIKEKPEGNGGIMRMKNAVWIDLVNALLWLISAAAMGVYWFKHRGTRTQFTARATV